MREPHPECIPAVFAWHTRVATTDVGEDRLLTPSAQLRFQQEAGELHFSEGNLGFEGVAALGMAFVAVQNNCVILRRPTVGEAITVTTWSEGIRGVKFFRRYRFTDASGETLIDSVATFVLVDMKEHRMLRSSEFPFEVLHAPDEPHICPEPPRLRASKTATACGTHKVTVSQLDFNGHLNNTRYADIVFDFLPPKTASTMEGFSIAFSKEAKLGDTLTVFVEKQDEQWFLHAQNGDDVCFTAQVREGQ